MSYHIDFIGITASDVTRYNSELMHLVSVFIRLIGVLQISFSIAAIFILFFAFRKKQKWSWYAFLLNLIVFSIPFSILTKSVVGPAGIPFLMTVMSSMLAAIGLVLGYIALFKE